MATNTNTAHSNGTHESYSHGTSDANLRLRALELAHESSDTGTADGVVGRAQAYLDFMNGKDPISVANEAARIAKLNAGAPNQRITDNPAPQDPHYPTTPGQDPNNPASRAPDPKGKTPRA